MARDIVERLWELHQRHPELAGQAGEAAGEIERLRAELRAVADAPCSGDNPAGICEDRTHKLNLWCAPCFAREVLSDSDATADTEEDE